MTGILGGMGVCVGGRVYCGWGDIKLEIAVSWKM